MVAQKIRSCKQTTKEDSMTHQNQNPGMPIYDLGDHNAKCVPLMTQLLHN